jgi:hypothetical protein
MSSKYRGKEVNNRTVPHLTEITIIIGTVWLSLGIDLIIIAFISHELVFFPVALLLIITIPITVTSPRVCDRNFFAAITDVVLHIMVHFLAFVILNRITLAILLYIFEVLTCCLVIIIFKKLKIRILN